MNWFRWIPGFDRRFQTQPIEVERRARPPQTPSTVERHRQAKAKLDRAMEEAERDETVIKLTRALDELEQTADKHGTNSGR